MNDVINSLFVAIPIVLLGYNPFVVSAYTPILALYAIFIHANVNWNYGDPVDKKIGKA